MKLRNKIIIGALISGSCLSVAYANTKVKDPMADTSYAIGYNAGKQVISQIKIDRNSAVEGVNDALSDKPSKLTPKQMQDVMQDLKKAAK